MVNHDKIKDILKPLSQRDQDKYYKLALKDSGYYTEDKLKQIVKLLKSNAPRSEFIKLASERQIERVLREINTTKNKDIAKDYYDHLLITYNNLTTKQKKMQELLPLVRFKDKILKKWTRKDVKEYLVDMATKYKPKTIKDRKVGLLLFFEWLHDKDKDKLRADLLKDVIITKDSIEIDKDVLEPKDVKEMMRVATTIRNKAIVGSLYETGARKGEFLKLKIKDIKLKQGWIQVNIPKGKTVSRTVYITTTFPEMQEWLESHPDRDNRESPLWVTQGAWLGRGLGEDALKQIIKNTSKMANIKKKVFPHLFRHSRATDFAKQGKNEDFLRRWFGWTMNSRMPSVYVHTYSHDTEKEVLKDAGLIKPKDAKKEEEVLKNLTCPRCKKENIPSYFNFCPSCSLALNLEAIEQVKNIEDISKKIKDDKKTFNKNILKELLRDMIKNGEIELT